MIYVVKKKNLVFVTQERPEEIIPEEIEPEKHDPILFILPWDLEITRTILRRYKCLWISGDWYKLECIEFLKENSRFPPEELIEPMSYIYSRDIEELLSNYCSIRSLLEKLGTIPKKTKEADQERLKLIRKNITYFCDFWNYLEELESPEIIKLIEDFRCLDEGKKKFLRNLVGKTTKEKRLEEINSSNFGAEIEEIIRFLPEWYKINYSVFGLESGDSEENQDNFIYSNERLDKADEILENPDKFIKESIYKSFSIGEIITGEDIKSRLEKIYKNLGILRTIKIKDLEKYFEIRLKREGTHRIYRLVTRKII